MGDDIRNAYFEATRQLGVIMSRKGSPFTRHPAKDHRRGIDFYTAVNLPRTLATSMYEYKQVHGVFPDIVNPSGFNEKVLWFKFFADIKVPESGNKLLTHHFIPEALKTEISCPEIIWHSESARLPDNEHIPPGSYYLKTNHGSGMYQRIQYPLNQEDRITLEARFKRWLKTPFGKNSGEWWYNVFPTEMLIECDVADGVDSTTWCVLVFGEKIAYISALRKAADGLESAWIDTEGKLLPFQNTTLRQVMKYELPANFSAIKEMAILIAARFSFARIDFLLAPDETIYLGEITFSPGNGFTRRPVDVDLAMGKLWELPQ